MASQSISFTGLSDAERQQASSALEGIGGEAVELRIRRHDGRDQVLSLPSAVTEVIESLLRHLASGERVAVLAEDQELSPAEASILLGISRPLVVHRMDRGDLPFRYVGKHRRASLKDVLSLKDRLESQRAAMEALVEDAEDLGACYGA